MVLDELFTVLQTAGIGTPSVSLFKGPISLMAQDAVVTLIEVPGLPSVRLHDDRATLIEQPMVQVITRGVPHDYANAREKAEDAYQALDGLTNVVLSGTTYLWIFAEAPPRWLRSDELNRFYVVFAVRCGRARP